MQTSNNVVSYRTHRVGSITSGLSMIIFGILLLGHSLFDMVDYRFVFSLWPVILIGLGIELLLSNIWEKKIVYDKGSIVLMCLMAFFAIGMAVTDVGLKVAEMYMLNGIM